MKKFLEIILNIKTYNKSTIKLDINNKLIKLVKKKK